MRLELVKCFQWLWCVMMIKCYKGGNLMKRKTKIITLAMVILIARVALGSAGYVRYQANRTPVTSQRQTVQHHSKKVSIIGKWEGTKKYPDAQAVKIKLTLNRDKTYQLVEENTVSQCWTRTYTGTYKRSGKTITCIPNRVVVATYSSKTALKAHQVSATDTVDKAQFYKQFGNQQHSKITVHQTWMKIDHDHEQIHLTKL